jgi:lipopolysaccharide transport system permease protein
MPFTAHLPHLGPAGFPVTVIERPRGWRLINVAEVWRSRELLGFLVWRDVAVRYKQTLLGIAWAVLQPLAPMLVFTVFLAPVAAAPSEIPYPLFIVAGFLPWTFAHAVNSASESVVRNQALLTKVYFPRLMIPMSAVGACLVDFGIACGLVVVLMFGYGVTPGWGVLAVPLLTMNIVLTALGVGTLFSVLTVAYRDFRHVVPFALQLWMFATPSIYLQGDRWQRDWSRALVSLNPMYGLIGNFRAALLGGKMDLGTLGVSSAISFLLLTGGLFYFRRVESRFADII